MNLTPDLRFVKDLVRQGFIGQAMKLLEQLNEKIYRSRILILWAFEPGAIITDMCEIKSICYVPIITNTRYQNVHVAFHSRRYVG